ncbi:GIP [Symbiodinium sp. CCMP2592]|nr:GIP [Symbiodinium sp. CCMP2592]
MAFKMPEYAEQIVQTYCDITGTTPDKLRRVTTPCIAESAMADEEISAPGELHDSASRILMRCLWLARLCRADISFAVTRLASRVTRWTAWEDRQVLRLGSYIHHTRDVCMNASCSWDAAPELRVYTDADFAACPYTSRSTSGIVVHIGTGQHAFPVMWQSRKQTSVARSTPEAEMISMASAMFSEVINLQTFLQSAFKSTVPIIFYQDNETVLAILKSGYSPKLRHLGRVHRVNVASMAEIFEQEDFSATYVNSTDQLANGLTKIIPPAEWSDMLTQLCLNEGVPHHATVSRVVVEEAERFASSLPRKITQEDLVQLLSYLPGESAVRPSASEAMCFTTGAFAHGGLGYDSDCRVRPAELLKKSAAGRSPYPWCETAVFDYWGVPCKEDFDLCLPPGEAEAFEKPDDKCTTPCGRDGKERHDMCHTNGMLFRREQRCVAALGVAGKVERPDREPEKFEGSMLNFAGTMNKLSVSGRLLTLSPVFDCNFRVTVEGPTSGQLPLGIDGRIRYTPTTEIIGDWSSAGVNEPFVHEDPDITELHFQLEVKGHAMQFDAVRLEQQCRAHVSGSGQFSDWSLVPHGQLRTPTHTDAGSNRGAQTTRRLKDSSPSQDSDDDSSDDDTDGARVKLSTCSEFVGVPCIDPATNVQTRCSDNQVCDSNYTAGGGFCRCADGFCWSYIKQACVDQSEHAREVVSKLLDETLLERHSPKLWATAKEVATVGFCAMEAAESLNNILRHVLAIGPGILISAWTAKLIFVQSTIPGYFSYFFTMVYSPAAWVLNNVWHQTASDWRLSLGLAAMAFWTIPVSVVGMKYGLHRPMSVPRAMSLVNNLLLLYYFVLFAAVVFIVMFVFSDEPETEAYFSVSAAFRRKLRPGKLSKTELLYVLFGFLTESFAVFFITCCAATDAFIMVIVKEHRAAWSLLTRGKPLPAVQADDEDTLYAIEEQVTRDWLLLMKESSEEDDGLAGRTLNTRLLRENERPSEPEEAVELTDMARTRGQEMEEPSV